MLYIKDNFDIHELTKYNGIGIVLSKNKYLIWLTQTFNKRRQNYKSFIKKFLLLLLKSSYYIY